MLKQLLTHYSNLLDEYLKHVYQQPEEIATIGRICNSASTIPNKLVVTLLNVERETAVGAIPSSYRMHGNAYSISQSPLLLNLNIVIAAVFEEGNYGRSLSVFSDALRFVQVCPKFSFKGMDYTVEILNISIQDLNNVWSVLGGQCYPSVLCKIRYLSVDGGEISSSGKTVEKPGVNVNGDSQNANR